MDITCANNDEQAEWLSRVAIEADPWEQDGQSFLLTPEILKKCKLTPKYIADFADCQVRLSDCFQVNGCAAMIGYVQDADGKVHVCGYYRNDLQGLWQYLPDYINDGHSGIIEQFGIGNFGGAKSAVILPRALQHTIAQISNQAPEQHDVEFLTNPYWILAGTSYRFRNANEQREAYRTIDGTQSSQLKSRFYQEVNPQATIEFGRESHGSKVAPSGLDFQNDDGPDFEHEVDSFEMTNNLYGTIRMRCFASKNNKLEYIFCQNRENHAWIGAIQLKSKVSTTGCYSEWVSTGDYTTPLCEDAATAWNYGSKYVVGNLLDMWQNYLSQMPVIRSFLVTHQNRSFRGTNGGGEQVGMV